MLKRKGKERMQLSVPVDQSWSNTPPYGSHGKKLELLQCCQWNMDLIYFTILVGPVSCVCTKNKKESVNSYPSPKLCNPSSLSLHQCKELRIIVTRRLEATPTKFSLLKNYKGNQ